MNTKMPAVAAEQPALRERASCSLTRVSGYWRCGSVVVLLFGGEAFCWCREGLYKARIRGV